MKVGDLVREITRMDRKPSIGIVLKVDHTRTSSGYTFPYLVWFDDGEADWMRPVFLEVVE
jgi:hypothetical protein